MAVQGAAGSDLTGLICVRTREHDESTGTGRSAVLIHPLQAQRLPRGLGKQQALSPPLGFLQRLL